MKYFPLAAVCAVSLVALSACGGGSSGTATVDPTFADVTADAAAMQGKYTNANGDLLAGVAPASTSDINSSANGSYSGYVGGDLNGDGLVGTLTVDANFVAGTASNTATDFQHETDGAYAGTLTGAGVIQPTAPAGTPQISTTLAGDLSNNGTDYATSIALDGSFIANGADPTGAIAGTADGTVGAALLMGIFSAEK